MTLGLATLTGSGYRYIRLTFDRFSLGFGYQGVRGSGMLFGYCGIARLERPLSSMRWLCL